MIQEKTQSPAEIPTSTGLAGGGAFDGHQITQESINAHLANGITTWDHDATVRAQRDEPGYAHRHQRLFMEHRWENYQEKPMFFRTAAQVMAMWPDEPANKD